MKPNEFWLYNYVTQLCLMLCIAILTSLTVQTDNAALCLRYGLTNTFPVKTEVMGQCWPNEEEKTESRPDTALHKPQVKGQCVYDGGGAGSVLGSQWYERFLVPYSAAKQIGTKTGQPAMAHLLCFITE